MLREESGELRDHIQMLEDTLAGGPWKPREQSVNSES